MSMLQDKDKVRSLHTLNQVYSGLTDEQRLQHGESFEKAAAKVMGHAWVDAGYSLESSGVEIEYYLRGALSASSPLNIDSTVVMKALARRMTNPGGDTVSNEARSHFSSLFVRPKPAAVTPSVMRSLNRLGFSEESFEAAEIIVLAGLFGAAGALKLSEWIGKATKKKRDAKKAKMEADKPINPNDIAWDDVSRVPTFLSRNLNDATIDALTVKEGTISGAGIVKRLTWGHQFDERDPVGFLTRMLGQYDSFYKKYEAAVAQADRVVQTDEKTTRPAVLAAKDDIAKAEEILKEARSKLDAEFTKAHTVFVSSKPDFPNGRTFDPESVKKGWSRTIPDPAFKDVDQIRPLTKDEAKKMVHLLSRIIGDMKKYTGIYGTSWSDHSDGDPFWDVAEKLSGFDDYCGYIYHQSADAALNDYVDDINEILAAVAMGVLTWIDRSFNKA